MRLMSKIDKAIGKIEEFILGFGVIAMAAVLIGNVISRTLLNSSWTFAEEVGQMLLITITFIGTSYAARKGKHVRMSAIFDAVPIKVQKIIYHIICLTTSVSMFFLTYIAYQYMMNVHRISRVTPALRMPMSIIVAVVAFGFLFTAIQYLSIFVLNLKHEEVYIGTEKINDKEMI